MELDDLFPIIPDVPRETRSIWNPNVPRGTSKSDDPFYEQWGDSMNDNPYDQSSSKNPETVKQILQDSGGADELFDFTFLSD